MSDDRIVFTCEACGARGRIPGMFRGKTARCPVCKAVQIIPMDAKSGPSTGDTDSIENPILTRSFSQPGEAKRTPSGGFLATPRDPESGKIRRSDTGRIASPAAPVRTPVNPLRTPSQVDLGSGGSGGSQTVGGQALLNMLERLEGLEGRSDQLQSLLGQMQETVAKVANTGRSAGGGADPAAIDDFNRQVGDLKKMLTQTQHEVTKLQNVGPRVDQLSEAVNRVQLGMVNASSGNAGAGDDARVAALEERLSKYAEGSAVLNDDIEARLQQLEEGSEAGSEDGESDGANVTVDLSPLEERLGALEELMEAGAGSSEAAAVDVDLSPLEERLEALEGQEAPEAVDLGPLEERLAKLEGSDAPEAVDLGPLEERLTALEKAESDGADTAPAAVDLSPVYERLDSIEEQLTSPPEAVAATAAPVDSEALEALQTRLDALAQQVADAAASEDGGDSDGEDLSVVLDRLDVLESRNPTVGDLEADPDRLDSIEARLGAVEQQEPSAGSADAERIEALEASVAGLGVQPQAAGGKGGMLLAVIALVIGLVAGGIGAKAFMDVGAASDGLGKRIDAVDTGISGLDTRVSANETALKSQGDTLAALDGIDNTVSELTTRLSTVGDDLAKRIGLSETALDGLGTRLGTFDTRLGSLDGELSGLEGKIGELGSALEALPDPAEAIQVLRDQVTALSVKLDELANRAVNTGLNSILGGGDSDNGSAPAEGDAAE